MSNLLSDETYIATNLKKPISMRSKAMSPHLADKTQDHKMIIFYIYRFYDYLLSANKASSKLCTVCGEKFSI